MKLDGIFNSLGRPCSFHTGQGEPLFQMGAFISPLRYKNKMYLYGVNTKIGYNSQGYYLYIGPKDAIIETGNDNYILCEGEKYSIDKAEKVYKGTEIFYVWAILRKIVEENE